MCLRDATFRSICEDLILAYRSLDGSGHESDAGVSAAVRELRTLCAELEAELLGCLDRRQEPGRPRL